MLALESSTLTMRPACLPAIELQYSIIYDTSLQYSKSNCDTLYIHSIDYWDTKCLKQLGLVLEYIWNNYSKLFRQVIDLTSW